MNPWMGTSVVPFLKCLFVFWCLYFGIWHFFRRTGLPSFETSRGRSSKYIERRTSNSQHRTSNIVDATLHLFNNKRITGEDVIERPRISKGIFVSLKSFFKLTEYIIRCWTFDVRCSSVSFSIDRPFFWTAAGLKPKPTLPMFIIMFPGFNIKQWQQWIRQFMCDKTLCRI